MPPVISDTYSRPGVDFDRHRIYCWLAIATRDLNGIIEAKEYFQHFE